MQSTAKQRENSMGKQTHAKTHEKKPGKQTKIRRKQVNCLYTHGWLSPGHLQAATPMNVNNPTAPGRGAGAAKQSGKKG